MTALAGGLGAIVLGIITMTLWYKHFFGLIAGAIPFLLLVGGGLAVYLGFEEAKDKFMKKSETPSFDPKAGEGDVEKYKSEVDRLKAEIEELKKK